MADIFDFYVRDNRKINFEIAEPIMREDSGVTDFRFHIPKILNGLEVSDWAWWFVFVNAEKEKYSVALTLSDDPESPLDFNIATYTVDYAMSIKAGSVQFALEAINTGVGGAIDNEWHTYTYETKVRETLQGNQAEYAETESDIISALLEEVRTKMNQIIGGATPIPVASVSQMTDTSKLYLLTTDGEWYYYNGSAWASGGVYGAGIVDVVPTLGSANAVQSGSVYDIQGWVLNSTIQDYIISSGDLVRGYIDTSTGKAIISETYSYYACSEKFYFFPCPAGRVFAAFNPLANYRYSIMCYDENRNFVGYKNVSTSSVYYTIPTTTKFVRFSITDTSHAMVSLTGDWWIRVRNAFTDVKVDVSQLNNVSMLEYKNKIIITDFIDTMSIDSSQGRIAYNANYKSAKYLYPVIPNTILSTDKGQYAFANYYDKDYVFIKSARLIHNTYQSNYAVVPVPENAAFVAFSFRKAETESGDITITVINSENILYAAGDACEKYAKVCNAYVDSDGVLKTSSNFNTYIFANVNASNVYANNIIGSNGVCIDKNGDVLANSYVVPQTNYGRLFNIPEGSVVVAINEKVSYTGDDGATLAQYASFVYSDKIEGRNLTGKKIYCIGDSITWLDNTNRPNQTGGIQFIAGYQRWLRAAGANVYSKGYDGYPIATGTAHETCIYTQVASIDKIDFSDCDYAIIEAGSNDLRYDVPVGDIATLYANANVDTATLLGAYGALTSYIRASNPKCIVIWVTPLPSNNVLKDFNKNNAYREGMLAAGAFWGCPVIDTMSLSGYNPNTNQLTYTYDGMHPNNKGMEIYGKLFANYILNRE